MDAKDEIKQRLSVEDVVGDYLELKRAGRNLKALSPFSSERTPSFMVSPEKQIWHDFSSNKGGDIFSFVMEVEGVDFRGALEILAKKANIDLSAYSRGGDGSRAALKQRLIAANEAAADFYHIALSRHELAKKYVRAQRGFSVETIRAWRLGYSPSSGTELLRHLVRRGFSTDELSKAGLVTRRRGEWGDMFRGRIMIPLCDAQGAVVGFTARLLEDNPNAPKYFNTPQTPIYDKGRQVFGLHHAKHSIRTSDMSVLVEGNLDVISSHQAGVTTVVACAGTAMTADHLRALSRLSPNVRLAFDADEAGLKATERAIEIAQSVAIELRVVTMPDTIKDPDELIQKAGAGGWASAIDAAQDAVTWTLGRYSQIYDPTTPDGKRQLSTKAITVIRGLSDPIEQEHHIRALADMLGVSAQSVNTKLRQLNAPPHRQKKPITQRASSHDPDAYIDSYLALNGYFPDARESLKIVDVAMLDSPERQEVYEYIAQLPASERMTLEGAESLKSAAEYAKILLLTAEEKYASWSPVDIMAEAMALARRITKKSKTATKEQLRVALSKAEQSGDSTRVAELLSQYQSLLEEEHDSGKKE